MPDVPAGAHTSRCGRCAFSSPSRNPVTWFGALNITPFKPVTYPLARLMMTLSRSIHEIVRALCFVAVVGLGAMTGIFALAMRSVGFIAKMSAEAIKDIDAEPGRGHRGAGAGLRGGLRVRPVPGDEDEVRAVYDSYTHL